MSKHSKNTETSSLENSLDDNYVAVAKTYQRIIQNKYIPVTPTEKQLKFLLLDEKEAFYGGAAGGGKSEALLIGSAMYFHVSNYNSIIFRKSYANLKGNLIPRSKEWWLGTDMHWNGADYIWTSPAGATLQFGYLNNQDDHFNYASNEYQYIAFDEVPEIRPSQYRFMFSRLRRTREQKKIGLPLRVRAAGNPVGPYVMEYKAHFNLPKGDPVRPFIPALIEDNPYLDQENYRTTLRESLDPVTLARLLRGDWTIADEGGKFKRTWFTMTQSFPKGKPAVRYWDLAATEPKRGDDPDYTVGALMTVNQGVYYIVDIVRVRETPRNVERIIKRTCKQDNERAYNGEFKYVDTYMEQEPGASGKSMIDYYARNILKGYSFRGSKTTGSKEIRSNPVSSCAEMGNLYLLLAEWNTDLLDEFTIFPYGSHDDQVDAVSGAFEKLSQLPEGDIEIGYGNRTW